MFGAGQLGREGESLVGNLDAAGEQLLGEDADFGAKLEFGFEIRLWGEIKSGGILCQPQCLGALQTFEDQRLAETAAA